MRGESDCHEPRSRDTDSAKDALDVLIDQSQRLFAIYDARRASAETKAAGILTADVAIAALTATAVGVIKRVNLALLVGLCVLLLLLVGSVVFAIYTGSAAGLRHRTRGGLKRVFGLVDAYLARTSSQQPRRESNSADGRDMSECSVEGSEPSTPATVDATTVKAGKEAPLLSTESDEYRSAASDLDCAMTKLRKSWEDSDDQAIIVRLRTLDLWQRRRDDAHELAQRKDRGVGAAGIALGFALLWGAVLFGVIILWHV